MLDRLVSALGQIATALTTRRPEAADAALLAVANAVLEATGNLSAVHIVGQIRLTAVDLLRATGMERARAQEAVRGAALRLEGT